MKINVQPIRHGDWLLFLGILLFLSGLVIGFFIPLMTNTRMGLSAHLEGTLNGMFLILLGIIWKKILVKEMWLRVTFWLAIYGCFANFISVTIAAMTGAGKMMPIAGGKAGTSPIEGLISFLLISLSLAMILVCGIVLTDLYNYIRKASLQLESL